MYSEIAVFMSTFLLIYLGIGCKKKKNEAAKLKPRDMSEKKAPPAPRPPQIDGEAPPKNPPMATRPADDNETINDAKSDWGIVP